MVGFCGPEQNTKILDMLNKYFFLFDLTLVF